MKTVINGIEYEYDNGFGVEMDTGSFDPRLRVPHVVFRNTFICTVTEGIEQGIFQPTGRQFQNVELRKENGAVFVKWNGSELGPVTPGREVNFDAMGIRVKIQVPSINTGEFQPPHRGEKE